MNELTTINQLEVEINYYKDQTARNIIEIGNRLIKAKKLVPYGEWGEWLEKRVDFSQDTANKFMRVAREFSNSEATRNLGFEKLYLLTALDVEERKEFVKENPVEDMTTRELKQAISENKALKEENERLRNKPPEIKERVVEKVVEVKPNLNDYVNRTDYNRLKKEYEQRVKEKHELERQMKSIEVTTPKEEHQKRLKDTSLMFSNKVHNFLNDVGGLGWLLEYVNELPEYEKQEYVRSVLLVYNWANTIKSNIGVIRDE